MQKFRRLAALTLAVLLSLTGLAPAVAQATTTTYWFYVITYDAPYSFGYGGVEKVIDNGATGTSSTGTWLTSSSPDFYGSDSLYSNSAAATYKWAWSPPATADYEVFVRWTASPNRSAAVQYVVYNGSTTATPPTVSQQVDGGEWKSLGKYTLASGSYVQVTGNSGAPNQASADAVKFVRKATLDEGNLNGVHAIHVERIGPWDNSTDCGTARGGVADLFTQTDENAHVSDCNTLTTTNVQVQAGNGPYWMTVYIKHPEDHPNLNFAGKPRSFHNLGPFGGSCPSVSQLSAFLGRTFATFRSCTQVPY